MRDDEPTFGDTAVRVLKHVLPRETSSVPQLHHWAVHAISDVNGEVRGCVFPQRVLVGVLLNTLVLEQSLEGVQVNFAQ